MPSDAIRRAIDFDDIIGALFAFLAFLVALLALVLHVIHHVVCILIEVPAPQTQRKWRDTGLCGAASVIVCLVR